MSFRRSLSFAESEKDLMDYFDNNGKSDFAKLAMREYIKNKDKILTDEMTVEIMKIISSMNLKVYQEKAISKESILPEQVKNKIRMIVK